MWRDRLRPLARLLHQTYARFDEDRIPQVAAGATFFILLAIFPAFASIVTLYGLIADRASIARVLARMSQFMPRGGLIVLNTELQRLMAQNSPKLGLTFLVSTLIAFWSASSGLKGIVDGLNIAYGVKETRGFLHRSLLAFLITAAAIILCTLAITLATLLPLVLRQLPFHSFWRDLIPVLGWPAAVGFSLITLAALYRFGPNHQHVWRWLSPGSILSSILWLAGTLVFKWYVRNFGNFDRVYGNLGAIVGFLVWIWLSLVIVLFGAELNFQMTRRRRENRR